MRRTSAVLLTIALAGAGCQTARVDEPLTRTLGGNDPSDQLAFWHALSDRGIVCNDEGFHGLLLFLNGTDAATTYAQRIEALQARGLLGRGFDRGGTEALQRGTLAVVLVKALGIKGGVLMHVVGPTPRYATRELRHLGIYGPDRPQVHQRRCVPRRDGASRGLPAAGGPDVPGLTNLHRNRNTRCPRPRSAARQTI